MSRLNARLTFAALALLLMAGPAMAQKPILEDRPVTMETLKAGNTPSCAR